MAGGELGLQPDLQRLQLGHRHVALQKPAEIAQEVVLARLAERQAVNGEASFQPSSLWVSRLNGRIGTRHSTFTGPSQSQ